jgi:hypothetical protein
MRLLYAPCKLHFDGSTALPTYHKATASRSYALGLLSVANVSWSRDLLIDGAMALLCAAQP